MGAAILEGILTEKGLAEAIAQMRTAIPEPSRGLESRARWLTLTILNRTQFDLVFQGVYFDAGRFHTTPSNVGAFGEMTFSACEKDGRFMSGVSGGTLFSLQYTALEGAPIGIGFSNPWHGPLRAWAGETRSAERAYEANVPAAATSYAPTVKGDDVDGNATEFRIAIAYTAAQQALVTLTQQIQNGGR